MVRIYVLIDPVTEEIRYVGWTSKTLRARLGAHRRDKHHCHRVHWINNLRNNGLVPRIALVQTVPNEQWTQAECYWIAFFRGLGCPLTNGTSGGEGMLGHHHSEGTRLKLRQATLRQFEDPAAREAVSRVHKGKTISADHRAIVALATTRRWAQWRELGLKVSPETSAKIRAARTGKPVSEETKEKIRMSSRQPKSPEHRAKLKAHLAMVNAARTAKAVAKDAQFSPEERARRERQREYDRRRKEM